MHILVTAGGVAHPHKAIRTTKRAARRAVPDSLALRQRGPASSGLAGSVILFFLVRIRAILIALGAHQVLKLTILQLLPTGRSRVLRGHVQLRG